MPRFRFVLAVTSALALTLSACGDSKKTLPSIYIDRAETAISRSVDGAFGDEFPVGRAECPDEVPMHEGLTFICTIEIDGKALRIGVTQTNDEGAVKFQRAQAVLRTEKLNAFVASYLTEREKSPREISCADDALVLLTPGTEMKCSIEYSDGSHAEATIGVKNTKGATVLLRVRPRV